jgi:hypothetical protein
MNAMPEPGIDRLAGILLGMVILEPVLLLSYLVLGRNARQELQPLPPQDEARSAPPKGGPME